MNLISQLLLSESANWMSHILCESLVDLTLIVVNGSLRVLQVLDIIKHVEGVLQGHEEVVHLIQAILIVDDLLE